MNITFLKILKYIGILCLIGYLAVVIKFYTTPELMRDVKDESTFQKILYAFELATLSILWIVVMGGMCKLGLLGKDCKM